MLAEDIRPVMVGGDHLCTLTVLRALRKHRGEAFGLILLDSHTDLYPPYFGGKTLTHGNPFRQAIEEGCLDPHRCSWPGCAGPPTTRRISTTVARRACTSSRSRTA
jgi:guanidinopropionase